MPSEKLPWCIRKRNADGTERWYWQRRGYPMVRLSDESGARKVEADRLNKSVTAGRISKIARTLKTARAIKNGGRGALALDAPGVYVAATSMRHLKIGVAIDPAKRMRELNTGNARRVGLIFFVRCMDVSAVTVERLVHRILAGNQLQGEWFAVSPETAIRAINRAMVEARA